MNNIINKDIEYLRNINRIELLELLNLSEEDIISNQWGYSTVRDYDIIELRIYALQRVISARKDISDKATQIARKRAEEDRKNFEIYDFFNI